MVVSVRTVLSSAPEARFGCVINVSWHRLVQGGVHTELPAGKYVLFIFLAVLFVYC